MAADAHVDARSVIDDSVRLSPARSRRSPRRCCGDGDVFVRRAQIPADVLALRLTPGVISYAKGYRRNSMNASGGPAPAGSLRSMVPSVFLPAMVFEIGNGAVAPIVAITALELGASPGVAGFLVALLGLGQLAGDVPAGSLAARVGDRWAMAVAGSLSVVAMLGCLLAPSLVLFGACLFVLGGCNATFYLARQSYLTEVAPVGLRARAMSMLGGSHRVGLFIGPFVGAAVIGMTSLHGAYVVAIVTGALTVLLLVVIPDIEPAASASRTAERAGAATGLLETVRTHRRLLGTLGVAVLAIGATRAARQVVLPLWAAHLGLGAAETSIVFGIAGAVDMALFYPSGKVMDGYGRLAVAVPSMLILGTATAVLPLTGEIVGLTAVAMVMSFGNGIGSGIVMTLGADTAPPGNRLRFLSMWRLMSDTGNALGPVLVSAVAAAWALAAGIVAVGGIGLLAAAGLARWAPRYSAFATRAMVRAQRATTAGNNR
jgi:MFS family permease